MAERVGLRVDEVSLKFGDETILKKACLSIPPGDTLALLGTSGSGKTSLLRIVAGLQPPDSGRVFVDNRDVTDLAPESREISMLFQEPALFPEKTIVDNALAARRAKGVAKRELDDAYTEIADMMDHFLLTQHKRKAVNKLSGGQFQRAAIVRCLANATKSKLLLLDEPFQSNLNLSLRWSLMEWLKAWLARRSLTCLLVTHDFAEAAFFADRVAVIDEDTHEIVTDSTMTLYYAPPNLTVARVLAPLNAWDLREFAYKLPIAGLQADPVKISGAEWCICRPASVAVLPTGSGFEVMSRTFLGSVVRVELKSVAIEKFTITADMPVGVADQLGKGCGVRIEREHVSFYNDQQSLIKGPPRAEVRSA